MDEIKILKLALENFKCHKNFVLDLKGGNASVYGCNYAGKSSLYDALTWLLFGKSSQGKGSKDFEVKPLGADGEVLNHDALTSVEAILLVARNGKEEQICLKRTYREVWSTKRGSSQATYDGNTSEYFADGIPMKMNAFQETVRSLVDEDTFAMLTGVDAFAERTDWKKRREVLFRLAGIEDDRMIMGTDERFLPLINAMGRSDPDGLKRKLESDKRGLVSTGKELPARISECEGILRDVASLDFERARMDKAVACEECDRLNCRLIALDQDSSIRELALKIRELMMQRDALDRENELYRKEQTRGNVDVMGLNTRMVALQNRLRGKENALDAEGKYMQLMESKVQGFRQQWMQVNAMAYDGSEVCPTCGQTLPALQLQVAKDHWAEDKEKRLGQILRDADTAKNNKAMAEERFKALQQEIKDMEEEITSIREQLAQAQESRAEPKDMEGYGDRREALTKEMDELNGRQFELRTASATVRQKLEAELTQWKGKIREADEILSKESLLTYTEERVEKLREDARKAGEMLEGIDGLLWLLEEYTRYKTTFVEEVVNDMFRITRFRLYRNQANGGLEDRCDVVLKEKGIPYGNASTSEKINMGMDIINTLSAAYGVRVPLFVDNAESVTNLEHCHSQRIRLVVSENDKELRVDYEA